MKVAINGFGRIGRMVFRAYLQKLQNNEPLNFEIVAINDTGTPETSAHLLKYDSLYGIAPFEVRTEGNTLWVNEKSYAIFSQRDPLLLPWKDLNIDIVLECTGAFTDKAGASKHIEAGAKKVVISAPAKDAIDRTIVMGVNHESYNPETDFIISNASCTTNGLAPVAKVLQDEFGIIRGMMTTIHAYTNDQNLHDNFHKDLRRARAATESMLPSSTGAAKAIGLVVPELDGKLSGIAVRIPTPVVSLVDLTVEVSKNTSVAEVNAALEKAASGKMKGILEISKLPLVSNDFKGNAHSSIVDALETQVLDGTMVKVFAWYDNEWGYSVRCVDLLNFITKK